MDKKTRLGDLMPPLQERFRIIGLLNKVATLEGRISAKELSKRNQKRMSRLSFINRIDSAPFLSEEDVKEINDLWSLTFEDERGERQRWITGAERNVINFS